jgi:hypothetical protein
MRLFVGRGLRRTEERTEEQGGELREILPPVADS